MIKLITTVALFVSTLQTLASTEKFTYFKVNKNDQVEVYHNNRTEFKIKITKHEIILMEKDGFSQSYRIFNVKRISNKVVYKIKEGSVVVDTNTVTFEFNN